MHILGRAGHPYYRSTIEYYLQQHDDPMVTRLALQILWYFWSETERYLDAVRQHLVFAPWDPDNDVRTMAISIAGDYLSTHEDAPMLATLLAIAGDAAASPGARRAAYLAIGEALGWTREQLPPSVRAFSVEAEGNPRLLAQARERLRRKQAG